MVKINKNYFLDFQQSQFYQKLQPNKEFASFCILMHVLNHLMTLMTTKKQFEVLYKVNLLILIDIYG